MGKEETVISMLIQNQQEKYQADNSSWQQWKKTLTTRSRHAVPHNGNSNFKQQRVSKRKSINNNNNNNNSISYIYRLPDEVFVYLLVECPVIDFNMLCALLYTSKRLKYIVCHVLRYYLLPYIRLATVIDQEGHGKWTCIYAFNTLNEETLHASFTPINTKGQRYRYDPSTNAPMLRYILAMMAPDLSPSSSSINKRKQRQQEQEGTGKQQQQPANNNSSTIASWMIENEQLQLEPQHRIINNPNCRLSVKQYSSQRVVQGTVNNSVTTIIPCAAQQERVMWRLSYIVDTMYQQSPSSPRNPRRPQYGNNNNNNAVLRAEDHEDGSTIMTTTSVRYMIPICLTTNITALSNGFTMDNQKPRLSYRNCHFVNHNFMFTWVKDKWKKWWCLSSSLA